MISFCGARCCLLPPPHPIEVPVLNVCRNVLIKTKVKILEELVPPLSSTLLSHRLVAQLLSKAVSGKVLHVLKYLIILMAPHFLSLNGAGQCVDAHLVSSVDSPHMGPMTTSKHGKVCGHLPGEKEAVTVYFASDERHSATTNVLNRGSCVCCTSHLSLL